MQVPVEHTAQMEPPWVTWWTDRPRWCTDHLVTPASTTSTTTRSTMDTCSTSRPPLGHRPQQVRQVTFASSLGAWKMCMHVCALSILDLSEYRIVYFWNIFVYCGNASFLTYWCRHVHICIQRLKQYELVTSYSTKCMFCLFMVHCIYRVFRKLALLSSSSQWFPLYCHIPIILLLTLFS
jgi:hypothetical protein